MLNGADGLSEVAAGLVAQGLTILESVKKGMAGATEPTAPGSAPRATPAALAADSAAGTADGSRASR